MTVQRRVLPGYRPVAFRCERRARNGPATGRS
jgi:hypothetical protein